MSSTAFFIAVILIFISQKCRYKKEKKKVYTTQYHIEVQSLVTLAINFDFTPCLILYLL